MKAALYAALVERSGGHCEACGVAFGLGLLTPEADHFWTRRRAPESTATLWLICRECHQKKHAGNPSAEFWVLQFIVCLESHGESSVRARAKLATLRARAALPFGRGAA